MDYKREINRRDKRIEACRQEISALRQLLDCAAANLVLAVKEQGGKIKLSSADVSSALGKYHLQAGKDEDGNYELEIVGE